MSFFLTHGFSLYTYTMLQSGRLLILRHKETDGKKKKYIRPTAHNLEG